MSRTIRIDDEIYDWLKAQAEPFEDTPSSVLRRVLGLNSTKARGKRENRKPTNGKPAKLPQRSYRHPILSVLAENGGRMRRRDVLRELEENLKGSFGSDDRKQLKSGAIRWRKSASWERQAMVDDGLLRQDSQRGFWELSKKGWSVIEGEMEEE